MPMSAMLGYVIVNEAGTPIPETISGRAPHEHLARPYRDKVACLYAFLRSEASHPFWCTTTPTNAMAVWERAEHAGYTMRKVRFTLTLLAPDPL